MVKAVFKPMPKLTAWVTCLIGVYVATLAAMPLSMLVYAVWGDGGVNYPVYMAMALSLLAYFMMYVLSGIATLVWTYGAVRNAKTLRPSFDHTPGWAIVWYFIPIANLFKPYEVMRDTFIASRWQVDGRYVKGDGAILGWWILHLIGVIVSSGAEQLGAFSGLEGEDYYVLGAAEWVWACGLAMRLVSTVLFLKILRIIYRDQMSHAQKEAVVF